MVGNDAPHALDNWRTSVDVVTELQAEIESLRERVRTLEAECRRLETIAYV